MIWNGVMTLILRYFTKFGSLGALRKSGYIPELSATEM